MTVYIEPVEKEPPKRPLSQRSSGMCKHCGVGIPRPPARYCPTCIQRAARLYAAFRKEGLAHCFHMGRLHSARYEWRMIEVAR